MARIGINSLLATPGGRWQVHHGNLIWVSGDPAPGGGLGFWYVHEVLKRDVPPFRMFRVQRDAVMWANTMNLRAP